ncbi:MAG: hypothetical protein WBL28_08575 [Methylotenera sp.]
MPDPEIPKEALRFASNVGIATAKEMTGKRAGKLETETGAVVAVSNFNAGNLSGSWRSGEQNLEIVNAASHPGVRAALQTMLPPRFLASNGSEVPEGGVVGLKPNGEIMVSGSRVTSGQGIRDGGSAGTLDHKGIDVNYDNKVSRTFYSPVAGMARLLNDKTNTIEVIDDNGFKHQFLHGKNIHLGIKDNERIRIDVGQPLADVSNYYQGVKIPLHLHYQIKDKNGAEVPVAKHFEDHPIEHDQKTVKLPNSAGTLALSTGKMTLDTAGGQHIVLDLNATNIHKMRFDVKTNIFSFNASNGLVVSIDTQAAQGVGGKLTTADGKATPFVHGGLRGDTSGALTVTSETGERLRFKPTELASAENPKKLVFAWVKEAVPTQRQGNMLNQMDNMLASNSQEVYWKSKAAAFEQATKNTDRNDPHLAQFAKENPELASSVAVRNGAVHQKLPQDTIDQITKNLVNKIAAGSPLAVEAYAQAPQNSMAENSVEPVMKN